MNVSKLFALLALCAIVSLTAHGQSSISHHRSTDGKLVQVRRTKGKVGVSVSPTPVPTPRPTATPRPTPRPAAAGKGGALVLPGPKATPVPNTALRQGGVVIPQIEEFEDITLEREREARLKKLNQDRGMNGGLSATPVPTPTPLPTTKPRKPLLYQANVTGVMFPSGSKAPVWLSEPDEEGSVTVSSKPVADPLLMWKAPTSYHLKQWDWLLEGAENENLRVLIIYEGRLYYGIFPAGSNVVGLEDGMIQYQLPPGKSVHWARTGTKQRWLQPDKTGLLTIVARQGMVLVRIVKHGYSQ